MWKIYLLSQISFYYAFIGIVLKIWIFYLCYYVFNFLLCSDYTKCTNGANGLKINFLYLKIVRITNKQEKVFLLTL